jgi:orotidine-5'-phosphate decarboxylase
MPADHFADRMIARVRLKRSHTVVGLDPSLPQLPRFLREEAARRFGHTARGAAYALVEFNRLLISAAAPHAALVKPQSAFYEIYGEHGIAAFWETVRMARQAGLLVIGDVKRGDIGSTAEAYAQAYFGSSMPLETWEEPENWVDAVTANPYQGSDALMPFVVRARARGCGLFVLVKTSNPSAGELQDQPLFSGELVSTQVARLVDQIGLTEVGESGYSLVGAVVGATYPEDLERLREEMPRAILLVPGYGVQGGKGADTVGAFGADGLGAVINASRSLIYASAKQFGEAATPEQVKAATEAELVKMNADIEAALRQAGRWAL